MKVESDGDENKTLDVSVAVYCAQTFQRYPEGEKEREKERGSGRERQREQG